MRVTLEPLVAPVTPAQALRRIAFLLERALAGSYRIEAFRRALAVVESLPPGELEERYAAGTLEELPGIGSSTATVIGEALDGELPEYLVAQQAKVGGPLVEGGEALTAALRGDAHLHSDWSDGSAPIEAMVLTAAELDHDWMVLSDHSPSLKVAHGLTAERLAKQVNLVRAIDAGLGGTMRVLTGIEVDILQDGRLDQREDLLGSLDLVVASVHSKLRMPSGPMTERMLAAVRNPHVDVLGHCTGRLVMGSRGTRPQSQFDAEAVFSACAEHGVAVEINSRPERADPPDDLIDLALDLGCLFSIDSDAHAPGQLAMKAYGAARAEAHGIPQDRIVTTWDADRVLAWAGRG